MPIDPSDVEGDAANVLRGFDPDDTPGARTIARVRLGPGRIVVGQLRGANDAQLDTFRGQPVIVVRPNLSPEAERWAIIHELVELHYQGRIDEHLEDLCELTTAAVVVPRRPFIRAVRERGRDWRAIAREFGTTETCIALRYGEVMDVPVAVNSPATRIRARGPERGWLTEEKIRQLSRAKSLPLGLRRERLHDDERRVVLTEEDDDP